MYTHITLIQHSTEVLARDTQQEKSKGGIEPSPFPRGAYDQDEALQNGER